MDVNRFRASASLIAKNISLEWAYIFIGCINSRFCFLVEKYEYLEEFYDYILLWCKNQEDAFIYNTSKKFELMTSNHYANFLRAKKKYDKALDTISACLNSYDEIEMNVDTVYKVNLELQKQATKQEIVMYTLKEKTGSEKLRRALQFKDSPEIIKDQDTQRKNMLQSKESISTVSKDTAISKNERQNNSGPTAKSELGKNTKVLKVNNENAQGLSRECEIPLVITLESSDDDIENIAFNNAVIVNTKKKQIDRYRKPANVNVKKATSNRNPLIAIEVSAKMKALRINTKTSDENTKKVVIKQSSETFSIATEKKSQNVEGDILNIDTKVSVRSKRNTRQQTKMLSRKVL